MSANLSIEEVISHLIFTERNIDVWEEYETNIIRNFNSKDHMAELLYKNIILNDNLFIKLFKNGHYPRKVFDFTGSDIWVLVEKCVHILVKKQMGQN